MINEIKNFLWALKRWKLRVVVDACILLNKDDLKKLKYLRHVFIPRAVQEQISRMVLQTDTDGTSEARGQQLAAEIESEMLEKIKKGKWKVIGSTGTGLLQSIENKKLGEFDQEIVKQLEKLYKRKKEIWNEKREKLELAPLKFDSQLILKDLIGSTDLRIIATCLNLKRTTPNFYLITRDKTLAILAKTFRIDVKERAKDL
ncbi:MAG: PIN domain-containing protein [Patescibacteria group bacterium]